MTEAEKQAIIALVERTGWEKYPAGINMSADHKAVFAFAKGFTTGAIVAALEKLLVEFVPPDGGALGNLDISRFTGKDPDEQAP